MRSVFLAAVLAVQPPVSAFAQARSIPLVQIGRAAPAAPLQLGANLELFSDEAPDAALRKLLAVQDADPAAALVLDAVTRVELEPELRLELERRLGAEPARRLEAVARELPELARTDRKLTLALSRARATRARRAPEEVMASLSALFDSSAPPPESPAVTARGLRPELGSGGGGSGKAPPGPSAAPPSPPSAPGRSAALRAKIAWLHAGHVVKTAAARVYRPGLNAARRVMKTAGALGRWAAGRPMGEHRGRWEEAEHLHRTGRVRDKPSRRVEGRPFVPESELARQIRRFAGLEASPMVGISGMSFPQLSAQSHLTLLYANLKLAKEDGVRILHNTGEGGPLFHIAMLEGDRATVEAEVRRWNLENDQFDPDSWDEAKLVQFMDRLWDARDALFSEFTPEEMKRIQIVAQFGSALNGIRGPGMTVDWAKLERIARSPYVGMIEFKLKQAAKRGAKVDPQKIEAFVAALREIPRGKPFKSPELTPEMSSYEAIGRLVRRTREVGGKPVSLKFGVGDARDMLDFLKVLVRDDALPDHVQIDGRGKRFSPGSGNAPPGANTSLPINEALIVFDALLKKVGARERVVVTAGGDILEPEDVLERLALGADLAVGARCWMGMGLGCSQVRSCANAKCPYGIAARSDSLAGLALNPRAIGPRAHRAGLGFHRGLLSALAKVDAVDWRGLRFTHGLGVSDDTLRIRLGENSWALDEVYDLDYVSDLLRGALSRDEVDRLVFRGRAKQPGPPVEAPARVEGDRLPDAAAQAARPRGAAVASGRGWFLGAKRALLRWNSARKRLSAGLRRVLRGPARTLEHHASGMKRHYLRADDPRKGAFRWGVVERLFEEGDFRGSFGHPVYDGTHEVLSPLVFREEAYKKIRWQKRTIGAGAGAVRLSPMTSYAGMPFEALSIQDHLALLYTHVKLAQDRGGHTLFNTGEGGWAFYLALLRRDAAGIAAALKRARPVRQGSWRDARILNLAEEAAVEAERVLGAFSEDDLRHVKYVAQFRSGFDLHDLRRLRGNPYVAMTQFNLDDRLGSPLDAARLMDFARRVTGKPVSLRLEVTSPRELDLFLGALARLDALPDHLQVEGRGPGSSGGESVLGLRDALVVVDAVLKKHGARDQVYVEATGDVKLPYEAVEKLALGADGVSSAKAWLGMAAGYRARDAVGALSGRDILDLSDSAAERSIDPIEAGEKGFLAAANWAKSYVQTLAETGTEDWRTLRATHGLASEHPVLRVQAGPRSVALDRIHTPERVAELLRGVLTPDQVRRFVFGRD